MHEVGTGGPRERGKMEGAGGDESIQGIQVKGGEGTIKGRSSVQRRGVVEETQTTSRIVVQSTWRLFR